MSSRLEGMSIHAEVPWACRRKTSDHGKSGTSTLHYRGWTLVDDWGWRWAAKDGTSIRVRVCRDHGVDHGKVMREYRRIVDEMEEER